MKSTTSEIEAYAKHTQFYSEDIPPLLSELLGTVDWRAFMDLGCGDGALLKALSDAGHFPGKSVYAVDLSGSRLSAVQHIHDQIICLRGDVCHTPLKDESIDFLISTQVIEHVQSDEAMVKEMRRLLKPGGRMYLSTIFKKWYGWYFYRCNGKWTIDPTHLREYTRDHQLFDLLERHGLEVMQSRKTLDGRPLADAVLRRTGAGRNVYDNGLLRALRRIRLPIPGYYIWEIVCGRRP